MAQAGKKGTHPSHLEQAKVWCGLVADPRVGNLTDRCEHGLIQPIHTRKAQRKWFEGSKSGRGC